MRKESFQGVLLGVVIMCAVFAFITIAWATFSSTLSISGNATVTAQSWKVQFTNTLNTALADGSAQTLTGVAAGSAILPTSSGLQIDSNHLGVSGNIGTFNQMGDKITYTWYAQNFGTFDADIRVGGGITNNANRNVTITCTNTSDNTESTFCAENFYVKLSVGAVGSPSVIDSSYTSTLAKANTTDNSDVLEFKLEIEFVGSNGSTVQVSPNELNLTISNLTLQAVQHTS